MSLRTRKFRLSVATFSIGLLFVAIQTLPAGLLTDQTTTHIEIGGVDYGIFENIQGLDNLSLQNAKYHTVRIRRDFVTDPSLYLWAKKTRSQKNEVTDIHVVTRNQEGSAIRRQVLKSCQPLSWSVEAINPSLGGFNETVELAVQNTAIF